MQGVKINSITTLQSIINTAKQVHDTGVELCLDGHDAYIEQTRVSFTGDYLYTYKLYSPEYGAATFAGETWQQFLYEANIKELMKKHALGDLGQEMSKQNKHALGDSRVELYVEDSVKAFRVLPFDGVKYPLLRSTRDSSTSMLRVTQSAAISSRYKKLRFCTECMDSVQLVHCNIEPLDEHDSLHESEELFGKICFQCKSPLADWSQCSLCRRVWWDECESHMCDELHDKLERDNDWLSFNSGLVERFHTNPIPD